MRIVQFACRERLVSASQEQSEFNLIEFELVPDVQQIDKHRCAGVAERIELGGVDQRLFLFANFFLDERASLIPGQPLPHTMVEYLSHAGR